MSEQARQRRARWISQGFETLAHRIASRAEREKKAEPAHDFDVLIVGSGYGGSIAAAELSRYGVHSGEMRIAVLERGNEYLPGSFPAHESELPGHLRFSTADNPTPRGTREGLFDIRLGADVSALIANGLGGGSLINAGVMLQPDPSAFEDWPAPLNDPLELHDHFKRAKRRIGSLIEKAKPSEKKDEPALHDASIRISGAEVQDKSILDNQFVVERSRLPQKFVAMRQLGSENAQAAPISISMSDGANQSGVGLSACNLCGNCMTGCNFSAKNSLDENLLAEAYRNGVEIFTGATVLDLIELSTGWCVRVVHTDPKLRRQEAGACEIRARRVILAAGTFGSTEILLRSRQRNAIKLSNRLGHRFSGNGDLLTAAYDVAIEANSVASDGARPRNANVGPTITSMIDLRAKRGRRGILIQEFAIPAPMRRLFQETCALAACFQQLSEYDSTEHASTDTIDPLSIDHDKLNRTLLLGVMGHDDSGGRIEIQPSFTDDVEGFAHVIWPQIRDDRKSPVFMNQIRAIERLMRKSGLGGQLLQNPTWKLMPTALQDVFSMPNGPTLTVHPLGGCPMGNSHFEGVVDHLGRVFNCELPTSTHAGLVVLDGSIIPTSLGVNPALTISALALRSVDKLVHEWQLARRTPSAPRTLTATRPVLHDPRAEGSPTPTQIAIAERLNGRASFEVDGRATACAIELTLKFRPHSVTALAGPFDGRRLLVDAEQSRLRVYRIEDWEALSELGEPEHIRESRAVCSGTLSGHLDPLRRAASSPTMRERSASAAWKQNRGNRDLRASLRLREIVPTVIKLLRAGRKLGLAQKALASHAGEVRTFDYSLHFQPDAHRKHVLSLPAGEILGKKRFTYELRANPWNQLMRVQLERFPRLAQDALPMLELDLKHLAATGVPLFQVVEQRDHATALFDVGSFLLYVLRLTISVHIWSFRKPDPSDRPTGNRLAGAIPGLGEPDVRYLPVGLDHRTKRSVFIRLARYQRRNSTASPVLLIHGYSANGMTYAHPAIRPNLVTRLCDEGHDVWVLDLRTSSGLAACELPWTFEEVATNDIPVALRHIQLTLEREQRPAAVDVVAHCMGAAMLSMAIFGAPEADCKSRLGKIVLSQVAPVMTFTPANIFRGFVMSYLRYASKIEKLDFNEPESLSGELVDRFLSTLPYPDEEFELENPTRASARTRYTRLRHRIDAWFGRVFRLANMEQSTLRHLDDLFGPVNFEMLLQTIHFARRKVITDRRGHNFGVSRASLRERWTHPTLSIHGMENGLADVATARQLNEVMRDAFREHDNPPTFCIRRFPRFGHQDSLIGRTRGEVFEEIVQFLANPSAYAAQAKGNPLIWQPGLKPADETVTSRPDTTEGQDTESLKALLCKAVEELGYLIRTPWIGPIVCRDDGNDAATRINLTADPQLGLPALALFVPLKTSAQRFETIDDVDLGRLSYRGWKKEWKDCADFEIPSQLNPSQAARGIALLMYLQARAVAGQQYEPSGPELQLLPAAVACFLMQARIAEVREALIEVGPSTPLTLSQKAQDGAIFALGSCQYPPGMLDRTLAWKSYERLAARLEHAREPVPRFAILTGDQVYVDATAGLFDPTTQDDRYELPYEKLLRSPAVRNVFNKINVYMMLDDHEIDDNWSPIAQSKPEHARYARAGKAAYLKLRNALGPPQTQAVGDSTDPLWFTLSRDGCEFFFVDSRTERSLKNAEIARNAEMISCTQRNALRHWLKRHAHENRPKFIVSPSIFLPRRLTSREADHDAAGSCAAARRSDAWDGFTATFHSILADIAELKPKQLVFLSGDEHLPCIAEIRVRSVGAECVVFHSIHGAALYAPYPFANGLEQHFAAHDRFEFTLVGDQECSDIRSTERSRRYECTVSAHFPLPGDGFVIVEHLTSPHARLRLSFLRASATIRTYIDLWTGPREEEMSSTNSAPPM